MLRRFDFTSLTAGAVASLPGGLSFSRASAATVQAGTSSVVTSGITTDVPRAGRRLDSDSIGLVIEETRTNWVKDARNPTTANWTAGTGAAPSSGFTGPDGSANAYRHNIASGTLSRYVHLTLLSGTTTASIWLTRGSVGATYQIAGIGTPLFGTAPSVWTRYAASTTGATLDFIVCDGRDLSGSGGTTAGARDDLIDCVQEETGAFATEFINTSGATATRQGERLWLPSATSVVSAGRLTLEINFKAKSAPSQFGAAARLWTSGADYAEISSAGTLTVSIGGSTNTCAINWAQYDSVDIFVAAGGSTATTVSYRTNGGAKTSPAITGAALGNVSTAGALDLLCNGTASQLNAWVYGIKAYRPGVKPSWA